MATRAERWRLCSEGRSSLEEGNSHLCKVICTLQKPRPQIMAIMSHKDNRQKEPCPCKQRSGREGFSSKELGHHPSIAQGLMKQAGWGSSLGRPRQFLWVPVCLSQSRSPTEQAMIRFLLYFPCVQRHLLEFSKLT